MNPLKIDIIHGPNLNLLGKREPEIYGNKSFESILNQLKNKYQNTDIQYFQSNIEGDIINQLQNSSAAAIIINAAGYAHTSVAIADAVAAINLPVISIHISNPYKREVERHIDLLSKYCIAGIYGMGMHGYDLAIQYLIKHLNNE